ncbi:MAG: thiopurine S-methyltransferase [Gammaproteobacteria bacterium]
MEHEFWHERWRLNQIGFHEPEAHPMLARHWSRLSASGEGDVLVPLCGKSVDMHWLARQGHSVVGSELSEVAVRDFFAELEIAPSRHGILQRFQHGRYRLWCGDFFELTAQHEPPLSLAYDRAALIALPATLRQRYAAHLLSLLAPGASVLLITLQHDHPDLNGPPFCVTHDEIDRLFSDACRIEHLEQSAATVKGRFDVQETASWLRKRGG